MGYDIDPISANCYPGTSVLMNKLNIREESILREAEALATFINAARLEAEPLQGAFDFEHYKAIHHFLFCDLYDWAGEIRTIDISKKGTHFTSAKKIKQQAEAIFARLKKRNFFKNLSFDDFVEEIVDFYCVTNQLHPFREGNGRAQRAFLAQLIRNAGYEIHFSDMDTDLLMIATIQASQGVTDLLMQIFREHIRVLHP